MFSGIVVKRYETYLCTLPKAHNGNAPSKIFVGSLSGPSVPFSQKEVAVAAEDERYIVFSR